MSTREDFFNCLIDYIDAAIGDHPDGVYSEYNEKIKGDNKKKLKESIEKLALEKND